MKKINLYIEEKCMLKIQNLVFNNEKKECGGYLIGSVLKDEITNQYIGMVNDVYCINVYGSENSFTFTSEEQMRMLEYINNENEVNNTNYHMIGNFHSHGQIKAYFSEVDEQMMRQYKSKEFYMVYSPKNKEVIAKFKDEEFNFYDVKINIINSETIKDEIYNKTYYKSNENYYSAKHLDIKQEVYTKEVKYNNQVQQELDKRFNFSAEDIKGKKVLVVGAGTIGNEIVKNLAFSGVDDITIVDMDSYMYYNLPRSPLVSVEDVGFNKAFRLAKRIAEKSPFSIKATGINADITTLGWGFLKQFDLIISPVDSYAIRKYIDRGCKLYNITHITAGTGLDKTKNNRMVGDVIVAPAGSKVCYVCTESGTMKFLESRTGCSEQKPETQPQVMGFSSTIAGIASSAALSCLLGKFHNYENGKWKDEDGNLLYWRMTAAEVGLYEGDAGEDVTANNLKSSPYKYQKPRCEYHSVMNKVNNEINEIIIKGTREKNKIWIKLHEIFEDDNNYVIQLEDWSLVYYLAYTKPSLPCIMVNKGSDYHEDLDQLPKEHVYKIVTDDDWDNFKIVRIIFEDDEL